MIKENPQLGIKEFKISRDSDGTFIVKPISLPIVIDEQQRNINMLLDVIKFNYVPRINDMFSAEIQGLIDRGNITEQIVSDLNSREGINSKDLEKLKSMTFEQLSNVYREFYREPTFVDVIPLSLASNGIRVYPVRSRGGFLIGGKFPLDAKSYRYRDSDGIIKTRLVDICEWAGSRYPEIKYPSGIQTIYFQDILSFEKEMLNCVKKLVNTSIWVKIYNEDIVDSRNVLSKVVNEFGMHRSIEESVIRYFNENGGNRQLFANGGTKEEYESFLSNTLYSEAMKKLLGVPNLKKSKFMARYSPEIIVDDRVEISILKNGSQEIYRKLHRSKTDQYPVPIGYNDENYPIYSKRQKFQLAYLVENGYLSPWYVNKIKIIKTGNPDDIQFEGDIPFVIDETSILQAESNYYVEQTFRDPMYGLPIVTRIGIIPKRIDTAEGHNMIKKINMPKNKYSIKEEPFKIKYFKSEIPFQSQLTDFKLNEAQKPLALSSSDLIKKSGYSIIDPRSLVYTIKYDPDDVWTWNPLKDYKVGAQSDNELWVSEKNSQLIKLKEWLIKAGASSSAFIAAKNEATRFLQMFRVNLPSQRRNELSQTRFKKPAKTTNETNLAKILKTWKKYTKDKLILESKRINYYSDDMKSMKQEEILHLMKQQLETDSKINASSIIRKIGITVEPDLEGFRKMEKLGDSLKHVRYIDAFIKYKFIEINPNVMKIIEDPKSLFRNYNRYKIVFNDTGSVNMLPRYTDQGPINEDIVLETIYEIIKNMSHTTNFGFNREIIDYVNDMTQFDKLEHETKLNLLSKYPIIKVIHKLRQSGLKINIWNILTTAYDMWYPTIYRGMKKETADDIRNKTLVYSLESPIEIKMSDVINYLGDSYYQNAKYNKGIKFEIVANKYTGNVQYLHPGYRFEKIATDEIAFTDKTSDTAKYSHNPYITMFRNTDDRDPRISIDMLVVGDELHSNKSSVTTNIARRYAFLYGVDIQDIEPYFSVPDPNISGKFRTGDTAVNGDDVSKFLAKGGNYYTILELPDDELKFRKLPLGDKITAIKLYRMAVKEYFKSRDKNQTYTDFVQKKRLNPLTLNVYINKVKEANVPHSQLGHYIDTLNILPDFLDARWPYKKAYIEEEFIKKTQIDNSVNINDFLSGNRREIYINVVRQPRLLFAKN